MRRRAELALLVFAALTLSACASGGRKDTGLGIRKLDCVVIERGRDSSGQRGARYDGTENYYLVFETREGEANARYQFQVTRNQWFRFVEGSHVRITLNNNILQDIRLID